MKIDKSSFCLITLKIYYSVVLFMFEVHIREKECSVFLHSSCISENGLCHLCQLCADTKEQRRGAKRQQEFQCEDMLKH